ncbi:MAG: hypothetical protein LBV50_04295 [Novosphingobium sp.]|jgi:hypothetical protein|nr:hypothetical protein [Novosphingobium sp.]
MGVLLKILAIAIVLVNLMTGLVALMFMGPGEVPTVVYVLIPGALLVAVGLWLFANKLNRAGGGVDA